MLIAVTCKAMPNKGCEGKFINSIACPHSMIKKFLPAIGIILFIYLASKIGWAKLYVAFANANVYYLLLAVVLTAFYTIIQTIKWNMIIKRQGIYVRFYDVFVMQLKSIFYGVVTPGRIGSFIKAVYLKDKLNTNFGKAVSSVLIDKVLDTLSIFAIAFFGGLLLVNKFLNIGYAVIFVFITILALTYVIFNKELTRKLLKAFYNKLLPQKYKEQVRESFYSFYENMPSKKSLILPFFVNILSWIWTYSIGYTVAMSLGMKVNYFVLITMYSIASIVTLIPITVSGIGTREATLVGLLAVFGVEAGKVVAMSLLAYFIAGILPAIAGLFYILKDEKLHKAWQES